MATKKKKQTRRSFSDETKRAAVAELNAGEASGKELEKAFGVSVAQIYVWRKQGFGKGSVQKTQSAPSDIAVRRQKLEAGKLAARPESDILLALSLEESVRLIVRDELTKLAEARDKTARKKAAS